MKRTAIAKKLHGDFSNLFTRYKYMSKDKENHVILESLQGGRYSIIGLNPFAILTGNNGKLTISCKDKTETMNGDPLQKMKEWMSNFNSVVIPDAPPFQGGAIGYISYDYVRYIEHLPHKNANDLNMPELYFLVFDDVYVYDHDEKVLWIFTHYHDQDESHYSDACEHLEELQQAVEKIDIDGVWKWAHQTKKNTNLPIQPFSEDAFKGAVDKIKQYISKGDVFQVNLSVRLAQQLKSEPLHIYEKLREFNPSPYMGYFHTPTFQLVSGSPELLVKKQGDRLSTRPIAGTRSRGKNNEEDYRLALELINNEKERAEHVMLVDLERNDLGRVCRYGTVEVNELMTIEKYSHVMHIVSNVEGEIDSNYDAYDAIRATFPGGTITGAPKIRTMEIIEELEPVRRGIYTGSIGWIDFNGDMELNIAIRTMVAKDGFAYVQAGAGIVIDSNPDAEYKESLKKAMALWKAKELSETEVKTDDIND